MDTVKDDIAERLEKEGWTRRFVADEPRLSEAVELYKEAGYEVHLEPLPKETSCETCGGAEGQGPECRICFEGFEENYRIIFTRPKERIGDEKGGLET